MRTPLRVGGRPGRLAFSPSGRALAVVVFGSEGWTPPVGVELLDLARGDRRELIPKQDAGPVDLVFSRCGGFLYSGSKDGAVRLHELESGRCVRTVRGPVAPVEHIRGTADGERFASVVGDKVWVWDRSGAPLFTVDSWSTAFSWSGERMAAVDRSERYWDLVKLAVLDARTGEVVWSRETPSSHSTHLFSPDGRTLVSGNSGSVALFDAETGRRRHGLEGRNQAPLASSPDGRLLACLDHERGPTAPEPRAPGTKIRLHSLLDGRFLTTIEGDAEMVTGLAFSPTGRQLAHGRWDGRILLEDLSALPALDGLLGG